MHEGTQIYDIGVSLSRMPRLFVAAGWATGMRLSAISLKVVVVLNRA